MVFDISNTQIKKALVSLAIEETLLEMGNATLEEVGHRLYAKYHSYFTDCLEHPEYLNSILKEIFGNSYICTVESIKKHLEEFANQKPIDEFLVKIRE